ncbi:hypothetical protein [Bacteroides sp.]|uniref:hypothetical protein n=1 Tax=Bacteroides sp. TaxID=29523 RepID=UPI002FC7F511
MKSENVILVTVLMFASIMIGGLTVQSCKSSKTERKTHQLLDSVGQSKHDKAMEMDSLFRLIKMNKWSLSYRNDVYIPVLDSTGRVTGSVLVESNTSVLQQEERSDSLAETIKKTTDKGEQTTGLKKELNEKVEETKRNPKLIGLFVIGIILFIIYIFKKTVPKFL